MSEIIAIIFDTAASTTLTPFLSDFKGKITPCFVKLQGIGSGLIAKGKGAVEYNFVGIDGRNVTIKASAYWVPDLRFRIFSQQLYLKYNKDAEFRMNSSGVYFIVNSEQIELLYNNANLPYVRATTAGTEAQTATIEANMCRSEENTKECLFENYSDVSMCTPTIPYE